ncbi:MAG: SDR family NAD(P)-dependent oxidoreductase [Dehalococcoidia bacterium]|nr:SDR family NAD(P)-dependent oxidoreductase [Dehalococcoidia bacterium]MDW8119589.1 SDR family NAD(P)-dependent oxidoreductase [Chloroflexota bacterium]
MTLKDKVAIVTGSSRGIGKAIALAYAREGAKVVVVARSETEGRLPGTIHQTAQEIRALGGEALPIRCDVTDEEQVKSMVAQVMERYGRIDVLVNNAAIILRTPIVQTETRHWDLLIRVNLRGPFLCCKYVLPILMAQRQGNILNITSRAAERAVPGGVHYAVSKAGLNMFTLGLAEEVREYNIAVNALDPGFIKTEGAVLTRPANFDWSGAEPPEVVGPAAVWLAQQTAQTFTGRIVRRSEFGKTWP